ncbi:hypothetical protein CBL_00951 [Carabus blaptoides fortunei]
MSSLAVSLLLGISDKEQLTQFLHGAINNLVGRIDSSPKTISSDIDWSTQDYETARKFVQNVYKKKVTAATDYDMDEDLAGLGIEQIQCIQQCYQIRKPEIQRFLTKECLAKTDYPVVTDFDWKLKWIIGSSTLSSLREPLLQMDVRTKNIDSDENTLNDKETP